MICGTGAPTIVCDDPAGIAQAEVNAIKKARTAAGTIYFNMGYFLSIDWIPVQLYFFYA